MHGHGEVSVINCYVTNARCRTECVVCVCVCVCVRTRACMCTCGVCIVKHSPRRIAPYFWGQNDMGVG